MRKSADQCRAVKLFEFVEFAAVDDPGDDLAHIVGPFQIGRHHAVNLGRIVKRFARLAYADIRLLDAVQIDDDPPRDPKA